MKLTSSGLCLTVFLGLAGGLRAQSVVPVSRGQITIIQEVNVPALETGVLGKINVRPGQRVGIGELLGRLSDAEARLDLKRVEIEAASAKHRAESSIHIEVSKKAHLVALAELRRGEEAIGLYAKALSVTEMDRLRFSAEQAELAIEQARELQQTAKFEVDLKLNEVDIAKRKVERHQFVSPLAGVVADVHAEETEWVEAGTPVFRLLRLDRLQCEGFISVEQAAMLTVGQPVRITVKVNEKKSIEVKGELTYISHDIDKFKNDVRVTAEFDNSKLTVRQGMRAEMQILPGTPVAVRK
jgi:multidrug efflux pump subunit AcrA (membrane-fusion protein)